MRRFDRSAKYSFRTMSGLKFVTIFIDQLRHHIHSSTNQIPFRTFHSVPENIPTPCQTANGLYAQYVYFCFQSLQWCTVWGLTVVEGTTCRAKRNYYKRDLKLTEGVQRRATKLVTGTQGLNYDDRMKQLGLMKLEGQRWEVI